MDTLDEARELAQMMIRIGENVGLRATALLSDMSQPLGRAVGNALEVIEAIETLQGQGPADLMEHCILIGAEMLVLGGVARSPAQAQTQLRDLLQNGRGLERFRLWIEAQGGDPRIVAERSLLPKAATTIGIPAPRDGYIAGIDAREVGMTVVELGAGRHRKEDSIDHGVGIVLGPKVGEHVQAGKTLVTIHARNEADAEEAGTRLLTAYRWSDTPVAPPPLVYDILRSA